MIDTPISSVASVLCPYQKRLEALFRELVATFPHVEPLAPACSYALSSGGKRLRPSIVWMVREALQSKNNVDFAAVAVELFHISSLITDDLPCMDDDDTRRGIPTVHKAFSEATAVLASFSLTAAGFEALSYIQDPFVVQYAVRHSSRAIGCSGLAGGQCLDLMPEHVDQKLITEIIDRKTVVLFDLAFVLGWICGGGSFDCVSEVSELARHFGRAFQIADDIFDRAQDIAADKKVNYSLCFGLEEARSAVHRSLDSFDECADRLGIVSSDLRAIIQGMRASVV